MNDLAILHIHREIADSIDLDSVVDDFIGRGFLIVVVNLVIRLLTYKN